MEYYEEEKLKRAKKRLDELKGFYIHLLVYLAVNTFIIGNIAISSIGESDSFWNFGTFVTPIFWGIGLLFHAMHTFHLNPFFGRDWEKKQIQKYMDEDRQQAEKFK